jgi:formylglycine-generating enzyme required for sulfatase activity
MSTDPVVAGILRTGSSGSYTYSVTGSANHPIAYVDWGDAARFANWLHNGQPSGPQIASTTEGGAYTLNGATSDTVLHSITRNAGAQWFIPSENEWYKAAYYQPAAQGGDSDGYWSYPMKTNSVPFSDQPPGATPNNTRVGNFYKDDGIANSYDDGYAVYGSTSFTNTKNYLTDVGAYASSQSYYGTFDQGGNLWEWNEAQISISGRGVRGGGFNGDESFLRASSRSGYNPASGSIDFQLGFRVATITPEPSTILLAGTAVCLFGSLRRRR